MKTRESGSPTSCPQAAGPQGSDRVSGRRRRRSPAAAGGWRATAERRTDGRRAGGRGRGPGPSYLRTPNAGCRQSPWPQPPPAVRGPRLLCDSDSRQAAAGDGATAHLRRPRLRAFPPVPGVRAAGTHEEEACGGRQRGQPPAVARAVGMLTYLPAARPASARSPGRSHPGTRRRSAASAATVAARGKHQTSGGGDASPVRWGLPGGRRGCACAALLQP